MDVKVYEPKNRSELTSAKMDDDLFAYIYDNIGNRTIATNKGVKSTYTANNLNEYTQVVAPGNTNAMKFDLDGNLTNDARFAYVWDAENRLTTVTPKSLTNGARRVIMTYDYMSRRTQKVVETRSGSAWVNPVTNKFLYDGWNLVQERSDGPTVQPSDCYYTWGLDLSGTLQGAGGIGGLLAIIPSDGGVAEGRGGSFPLYDANGNITDYISTNGTILAHYEYDPYGNVIAKSGSMADTLSFRFSSKYTDDESGLVYYGFRYYSPGLGRWVSRDPIGEQGGNNLYLFVLNQPNQLMDAVGLNVWTEDVPIDGSICLFTTYHSIWTLSYDDVACSITMNGPTYTGVTIAPPNSAHDVGDVYKMTVKTGKCCKNGVSGTWTSKIYTFRVRQYTIIGFKGFGIWFYRSYSTFSRTIDCPCKVP